jgi:membrane-associated phospholipid phosphatase
VIAGSLVLWFWTQSLIARKPSLAGLGDMVHQLTAGWHGYLNTHPRAANATLIASSLFIDLFGISLIALAVFGPTFAPFLALMIVFGMRQLCQGLCTLPPPPGMIWRRPGVPSLLVTYDVGNDLFFSGHTALAVLGALELAHFGPVWLGIVVGVIAAGEALAVLVLRAHYTLDVVAGALAAFFAVDVAHQISPLVDAWLH